MDTIKDFEDMLRLMQKHKVKYLIVGGLAFIYHAKPRYTKDIDLWVDPAVDNIRRANAALAEFGSPFLMEEGKAAQVVQVGVPPNRIDLLQEIEGLTFAEAWEKRDEWPYGKATANWIDMDSLIKVKERIQTPRHQEDVRALLKVKAMREAGKKQGKTKKGSRRRIE